jgi:hypothetical protein
MATPAIRFRYVQEEGEPDGGRGTVVGEVQSLQRAPHRLSLVPCANDREGTRVVEALGRAVHLGRYSALERIKEFILIRHGLEEEGRLETHLVKEIQEAKRLIGLNEDDEGS